MNDLDNVTFLGNAFNISSALYLIDQHTPDVVILDIHLKDDMPGRNGIDLLITLRKKYRDMKIMMLTNLTAPQYRKICIACGADYFFDKSNDFDRMQDALRDIHDGKPV